jgi:hypothetical protein|tara:strand:+ start:118 stop:297 length:180 start_codon:yes stop_codon:yes gene_type:complete
MRDQEKIEAVVKRAQFLKRNNVEMSSGHPNRLFIKAELESIVGLDEAERLVQAAMAAVR